MAREVEEDLYWETTQERTVQTDIRRTNPKQTQIQAPRM